MLSSITRAKNGKKNPSKHHSMNQQLKRKKVKMGTSLKAVLLTLRSVKMAFVIVMMVTSIRMVLA